MRSKAILICIVSLLISGCSTQSIPWVYRIDIPQGNVINKDMLTRVRVGMSQDEVKYILGSPMLVDTFHQNQWDYYYHFAGGDGDSMGYHLRLHFKGKRIARIEKSGFANPIPSMTS